MRIKNISISNYRQYKNLNFSFDNLSDPKHDMFLIIAQNGVGKSNFLNAITWCLYNEESHLQDKYKALPIVNLRTIDSAKNKENMVVEVSLTVETDNKIQIIKRTETYAKNDLVPNKCVKVNSEITLTKNEIDPSFGFSTPFTLEGENAQASIDKIFPKGINEYFFFDNEQMDKYFTNNKSGSIERAINVITKIDIVQKVIERLKALQKEYRVSMSDGNQSIMAIKNRVEKFENNIETEKGELKATIQQIIDTEAELENIKEEVKGAENLKLLEGQRELLNDTITGLEKRKKEIKDSINSFMVEFMTLINMYPAFVKTLELIDERDRKNQLPPEISIDVLERSKNEGKCKLCGCSLKQEQIDYIINKLREYDMAQPASTLLLNIRGKVTELKNKTETYKVEKQRLLTKLESIETEIETNSDKLNDLNIKMKSVADKDEMMKKLDKRDLLEITVRKLRETKGALDTKIKGLEDGLFKANKEWESAIKSEEKNKQNVVVLNSAKKLEKVLDQVELEMIEEIRNEISSQTFENFKNLIWKKNTYSGILIDEDYNVDLIHSNGMSAIGSTSAAERALLALSFTNAIHKVSGFESPLVIDSPVGRVSDINRRKFSETLAKISEHKQIIMLFTPDEYSDEVSQVLDSVATKTKALMNSEENVTNFEEV